MVEFVYTNYHTEYSSTGTDNIPRRSYACFASVFGSPKRYKIQDNVYKVYIFKGTQLLEKARGDNNCFLNKEEISRHLSLVKGLVKFSYRITEKTISYNKEKYPAYVVMLHVVGKNIYHRFILTWLRYLYEFPYNFIIREAAKVRQEEGFKRESIFNLFQLIGESIGLGGWGGHSISNFQRVHELVSLKTLKDKLKRDEDYSLLNNLLDDILAGEDPNKFGFNSLCNEYFYDGNEDTAYDNAENYRKQKTWEDEEQYKERLELYRNNYKLKKKYTKKNKK